MLEFQHFLQAEANVWRWLAAVCRAHGPPASLAVCVASPAQVPPPNMEAPTICAAEPTVHGTLEGEGKYDAFDEEDGGASSAPGDPGGSGGPSLDDFLLMRVIGKGSFGKVRLRWAAARRTGSRPPPPPGRLVLHPAAHSPTAPLSPPSVARPQVLLVRKRDSGQIYAMKVLRKKHVLSRNQVEHTMTERSVLERLRHPFIVGMRYAFQVRHGGRSSARAPCQ